MQRLDTLSLHLFTQHASLQVPSESLVSQAVNDGTEKPREHLYDDVTDEQCIAVICGEPEEQTTLQHRGDVGQHAEQQLEGVQQDSVPGLLCVCVSSFSRYQDLHIDVEQDEPHQHKEHNVVYVDFLDEFGEDVISHAEHP